MEQIYSSITELLRHFYGIIGRAGAKSTAELETANRIDKLVSLLVFQRNILERKTKSIEENYSGKRRLYFDHILFSFYSLN
jgi:hypothetical protein